MCNKSLPTVPCGTIGSCGINNRFQLVSRTQGQVAHALLTRPPLIREPKFSSPFDLNVLCTPPALILSQDQTLEIWYLNSQREIKSISSLFCSFFTFFRVVFSFRIDKFQHLRALYSSYCSIFKDHSSAAFCGRPYYCTTKQTLCQVLFQTFFKFFCTFLQGFFRGSLISIS